MVVLKLLLLLQNSDEVQVAHILGKFKAICHQAEESPTVMFPLPRDYRGQVPVRFTISFKPRAALVNGKTYATPTGDQTAEFTLKPMKRGDIVEIEWKADVYTRSVERFQLPESVSFPESYPEEILPWLKASRFVDSDHPEIIKKSAEFKSDDVLTTINNVVVGCVAIGSKQKGQAREMTASIALKTRGSCTSNANLMAALLRANRIPARILSGYPTWVTAPYQTHYIVEAFVPGFGWYPIESTMYAKGWPCNSMPIVSIVSIENENKGKERLNGGGGVAYLSLTETSAGMLARGSLSETYSDHRASLDKNLITVDAKQWEDAQKRWTAWLNSTRESWSDFNRDDAFHFLSL